MTSDPIAEGLRETGWVIEALHSAGPQGVYMEGGEGVSDMPEKVWLNPDTRNERLSGTIFQAFTSGIASDTEYVRSDIYAALESERDALKDLMRAQGHEALRHSYEQLQAERDALKERVARLVEAGDRLCDVHVENACIASDCELTAAWKAASGEGVK